MNKWTHQSEVYNWAECLLRQQKNPPLPHCLPRCNWSVKRQVCTLEPRSDTGFQCHTYKKCLTEHNNFFPPLFLGIIGYFSLSHKLQISGRYTAYKILNYFILIYLKTLWSIFFPIAANNFNHYCRLHLGHIIADIKKGLISRVIPTDDLIWWYLLSSCFLSHTMKG